MKPAGYSSTAPSKLRTESTGQTWTLIGQYRKTLQAMKGQLSAAISVGNDWQAGQWRIQIASVAEMINDLEERAAAANFAETQEKLPIGVKWTREEYGKEDERI